MTREEAKELLPIIQAFAECKTIQQRRQVGYEDEWFDVEYPSWEGFPFDYRIKPESTYRPFKNKEECWEEMKKHQPFGWIKDKYDNSYSIITKTYDDNCEISGQPGWTFGIIMLSFTFSDGTPFGLKEDAENSD